MNNLYFINAAAEDYHTRLLLGEPMPENFEKPIIKKVTKYKKPTLKKVKKK